MEKQTQQTQNIRRVKLFPAQYDAYHFPTQFGAAVAGVQSGKTFVGSHWSGKQILENPDKNGAIVAPTYKILQQSTLPKFLQIFPELRKYHKSQKGEIELPTGGVVYIRSADNPLGIEGMTLEWWWLDEGGMVSPLTYTILRSRVSMTGGRGFITTTPYNMGWLYQDFYLPWRDKKDKALSFYSWASIDNPRFPKDFYEAERKRLQPEEFARRYMGKFSKLTGLVWDIPDELVLRDLPDLEALQKKAEMRIIGVDWGFRNPAAVAVCYLRDKEWYVVDEWRMAERTTAEIIQVIKNKMTEHRATQVFPDPAEPDRIQECRNAGIPIMEVTKDIKGGISYVQQLIREKRFKVFGNCQEFLTEASMYQFPEGEEGKAFKDEPEKLNDHLCDAVRYAIYSCKSARVEVQQATAPIKPYYTEIGF